jgi:aspartyl-tRNA(Asn)/glutamyl-tRNA(Gln) amidotransferase subunit A
MPSSLCGTVGIKPTYGRVDLRGTVPLSWSLDHLGPIARSVRDCAVMLDAMADAPPSGGWTGVLENNIRGLRIGVPTEFAFERADQDVATLVHAATAKLGELGAEVRHLDLPILNDYWRHATIVLLGEAAAYHQADFSTRRDDYGEDLQTRLQAGTDLKAVDYIASRRAMEQARSGGADESLFSDVDLLAMPSTVKTAVPIASVTADDPTLGYTWMTAAFDLTGQPAISVPCGLTASGLPAGLQLIGKSGDEATVLRAAHAYEEARGTWPRPPVD